MLFRPPRELLAFCQTERALESAVQIFLSTVRDIKSYYDQCLKCSDCLSKGRYRGPFKKPNPCKEGIELDSHVEGIDLVSVNEAALAGQAQMESMIETEKRLVRKNIVVRKGSGSFTHSWVFFHSTADSVKISNSSLYGVFAVQQLSRRYEILSFSNLYHKLDTVIAIRYRIKPEQVECVANRFQLKDTILYDKCPAHPDCDERTLASPFRTMNGSCNNPHPPGHVPWGLSKTQYQRALPPAYADGMTKFIGHRMT